MARAAPSRVHGRRSRSAAVMTPRSSQAIATATASCSPTTSATRERLPPSPIAAQTPAPAVTAPRATPSYYTSLSVPVTKNGGTDGGSGVDGTTSVLQRDDAALTNGACGGFSGTWTTVTLSVGNDTSVT